MRLMTALLRPIARRVEKPRRVASARQAATPEAAPPDRVGFNDARRSQHFADHSSSPFHTGSGRDGAQALRGEGPPEHGGGAGIEGAQLGKSGPHLHSDVETASPFNQQIM